jgi:hypothetical protein
MAGEYLSDAKKSQVARYIDDTKKSRERLKVVKEFDPKIGLVYAASPDDLSPTGGIRDWALVKIDPQRTERSEAVVNKVSTHALCSTLY